jgi:hypothetical protein
MIWKLKTWEEAQFYEGRLRESRMQLKSFQSFAHDVQTAGRHFGKEGEM